MLQHNRWIIAVMLAALALAGCSKAPAKVAAVKPATLEATQDAAIKRITLTERAEQRLGIEFGEMTGAGQRLEAPYSALFYDASGGEWVYTSPKPQVFERAGIKIIRIEGDKMYLSQGPVAGTKVVTAGAALLFGAETGL